MGRIRSFYSGKEARKKYQSFLHRLFSCMERWQHKNTDTNPCQTVLRASGEALIQSLSAFILEILCNARNGMTRIANYLRNPMTKQYIKFLIKADSVNESVLPRNQAPTLSVQESPAAALNLSSGNAGSCCKGWYPCFLFCCHTFLRICRIRSHVSGPRDMGEGKSGACTGIHSVLSIKAAFRPEYSRYTWQTGIESFHGVSWFPSPYIYIA